MNVKEYIDGGYYRRDPEGRARVKCRNGQEVVIYTTNRVNDKGDLVRPQTILGDVLCGHINVTMHWDENGRFNRLEADDALKDSPYDLMPPTKTVTVEVWGTYDTSAGENDEEVTITYKSRADAEKSLLKNEVLIFLTGTVEVPL